MAISIERTIAKTPFSNVSASSSISFASLPAVGSVVIVEIIHFATSADLTSVADNQGHGNYTLVKGTVAGLGNLVRAYIASMVVATSSGTFTITIDWGPAAGNYANAGANSWLGLSATPSDQTGANAGTQTATDASVSAGGANAQADELVVAVASVNVPSDGAINITTAATGYTNLFNEQSDLVTIAGSADYKIVSASETSAASWSHDAADGAPQAGWSAVIATFNAAAGGVDTLMGQAIL